MKKPLTATSNAKAHSTRASVEDECVGGERRRVLVRNLAWRVEVG